MAVLVVDIASYTYFSPVAIPQVVSFIHSLRIAPKSMTIVLVSGEYTLAFAAQYIRYLKVNHIPQTKVCFKMIGTGGFLRITSEIGTES